jgi:FtsP/CotA-like multicopper oxidase with cupredoxin domain
MPACESVAPYPWHDPESSPVEHALPLPVEPYVDELYVPPMIQPTSGADDARLRIWMVPAKAQLHSDLPNLTDVWVYRESGEPPQHPQVPVGPTIEVQHGQRVHVDWVNALTKPDGSFADHPVVAVRDLPAYVQCAASGDVHAPENLLGFTCGRHDHLASQIPPWTVVHLHGARTAADYDGWPETAYYPGQIQSTVYENHQPGTMLWYHDHGMAITRLNVYAGLAGLYIIRDPQEAMLNLPHGADDHELLLLIQDRALTLAGDHPHIRADQLLHKTGTAGGDPIVINGGPDSVDQAPMEFFGPLTLVNGRIWPRATVHAVVYRLRILNGSNARTYRLRFTDGAGNPVSVPLQMIGSDGGLLARPLDLNDGAQRPDPGSITLASAERVDVLVDFRAFAGQRIELRNFAKSPFDGTDADSSNPLADFLTYPQVMCFDIGAPNDRHQFLPWDQSLLPSATPWSYDAVRQLNPVERLIALVENDQGVLQLLECAPMHGDTGDLYWDGSSDLPPMQLALRQRNETRHRRYCMLPGMFSDTVHFLARDGDVEIWKLINLSGDTHPIHLHLVQFKLLARDAYSEVARVPEATDDDDPGGYTIQFDPSADAIQPDPAELGWKDTIRVDPAQMAIVAVPFRDYAPTETLPDQGARLYMTGRYMYHCHILEHEDHEMMRPYVVMPPEVVDHMHHEGTAMHGKSGGPMASSSGWYMEPDVGRCTNTNDMGTASTHHHSAVAGSDRPERA